MTKYLEKILIGTVGACWMPGVLYAAGLAAFPNSSLEVPIVVAFATLFFSTLMGVTTLAFRVLKLLEQGADMVKPWLYIAAHMLGAWSAGAIAFVGCMAAGVNVWGLLASVCGASLAGSKYLEKKAEGSGTNSVGKCN